MKKSLIALAVLGAFAGAASAQSSVTLSGILDASLRHRGTATGYDWSMGGSQSAYNSFTLSGREDLGGGLYAFFGLNHRFTINNGAVNGLTNAGGTNPFWRNTAVGLGSTALGDVRLGRILMPLQDMNGVVEAFATGTVGTVHTGGINATIRANNAVYYRSPSVGGIVVHAAIAAGEGQTVDEVGDPGARAFNARTASINSERPAGLSVRYVAGPIFAGLAYDKNGSDMKTVGLYGSYDFGVAKLGVQFEKGDNYTSVSSALPSADENIKAYSISAIVPFGTARLFVGAEKIKSDLANRDASKLGIGGEYSFSKRTLVYSDIGKWSGNRISVANKKTQFDVGVRHFF